MPFWQEKIAKNFAICLEIYNAIRRLVLPGSENIAADPSRKGRRTIAGHYRGFGLRKLPPRRGPNTASAYSITCSAVSQ